MHIPLVELRVALHEEANDAYVAKARRREKSRALVGATAHVNRSAGAEKFCGVYSSTGDTDLTKAARPEPPPSCVTIIVRVEMNK